jgi:hypothetical protein
MFAYLKLNTEFGRVVPYYPFMMKVYERILPRQAVSVPVKVPVRTGTHTLSHPLLMDLPVLVVASWFDHNVCRRCFVSSSWTNKPQQPQRPNPFISPRFPV